MPDRAETLMEIEPPPFDGRDAWFRILSGLGGDFAFVLRYDRNKGLIERWFSPQALAVTGYSPEELAGLAIGALVHPDDVAPVLTVMREGLGTAGHSAALEFRIRIRDGSLRWVRTWLYSEPDADTVTTYGLARDITSLRSAEARVRYQASLVDKIADAVIATDDHFVVKSWSAGAERLYGWTADEAIGRPMRELAPWLESDAERQRLADELATHGEWRGTVRTYRRDGAVISVASTVSAVPGPDGGIDYIALNRDVSELVHNRERLSASEERFRRLVEVSPYAYFVVVDHRVVYANEAAVALLAAGVTDHIVDQPLFRFLPDDRHLPVLKRLQRALTSGKSTGVEEERLVCFDGSTRYVELGATPISFDGEQALQIVANDVTGRKEADDRLRASLSEKETLLREIHHRVKNNLQIISSLLRLQSRKIENPRDAKRFEESQHRVKSIALVHEMLHDSIALDRIDFRDYVAQLAPSLVGAHGPPDADPDLTLRLDHVHLELDIAAIAGLILNELLSNALKHGVVPGRQMVVEIELAHVSPDSAHIIVRDNGPGLPPEVDLERPTSLGLQLVAALTQQAGGEWRVGRSPSGGTEMTVRLPR